MPEWKKKTLDDVSKSIVEVVRMKSGNTHMEINKLKHLLTALWH